MRLGLPLLALLVWSTAAHAGEDAVSVVNGIRIIDARLLSVAELQAMAAAERANATPIQCCDWSGGGCRVAAARAELRTRQGAGRRRDLPGPS